MKTMKPQENTKRGMIAVLLASALCVTAMSVALGTTLSNYVCLYGTDFIECFGDTDCSGSCDEYVTDSNIYDCTAEPSQNCSQTNINNGVQGKHYTGTCGSSETLCECLNTTFQDYVQQIHSCTQ